MARDSRENESEPRYVISIAARMIGVHVQVLRYYEREGLLQPSRSAGNIRLYSERDMERLRQIRTLMEDMGVNLAGVEIILRLREHIKDLEQRINQLESEIKGRVGEGK